MQYWCTQCRWGPQQETKGEQVGEGKGEGKCSGSPARVVIGLINVCEGW